MTATFDVRFHANSFQIEGAGQFLVEPDFVLVRGTGRYAPPSAAPAEVRLRRSDIVNAHAEGDDVHFQVLDVRDSTAITFSAPDAATAQQILALLPERQTEAFARAEFDTFHDRIDYWSPSTPVIWALLVLNVGIYYLMWLWRRSLPGGALGSMLGWGWNSPFDAILRANQLVAWGSNNGMLTMHGQPWRLFTSLFLHGSLMHLGFNMLALWQVGQLVERLFGSLRFIALYVLAGLCGSIASVMWNPHVNSVGASGAIFGIVGGLFAFMQRENSGVPPTVVKDLRGSLLPFLVFNLAAGFLYPHTDNAAHIGGLVGGWLAGHLLARSLHVPAGDPQHERRFHRHL
jgi:membrane associated rhomboid family serine protease